MASNFQSTRQVNIGVFDSGIGGLTVLDAIAKQLPQQHLLYVADSAHQPYGDKSSSFILQRCRVISRWLIEQGCQIIVIACNTATTSVIQLLRAEFDVQFVGVEPAVKPAMKQFTHIAVLATENTIESDRLSGLISQYQQPQHQVSLIKAKGLACAIELNQDKQTIQRLLQSLLKEQSLPDLQCLVLACTHYPIITAWLQELLPDSISILEPSGAVAKRVESILFNVDVGSEYLKDCYENTDNPSFLIQFFTTDNQLVVNQNFQYLPNYIEFDSVLI